MALVSLSRRRFSLASLALGGCCIGEFAPSEQSHPPLPTPAPPDPAPSSSIKGSLDGILPGTADVLVIGAGVAGLAAARELAAASLKVVVLEARDRVGGRIWTDTSLGAPIDMGAAWIHGHKGNPLVALAGEMKLETRASSWDRVDLHDADGAAIGKGTRERAEKQFARNLREAIKGAAKQDRDAPLGSLVAREAPRAASDRRLFDWFARLHALDLGEDLDRISSLHGDDDDEFPGDDLALVGGYGGLVEGLKQGLDIRLSHEVSSVELGKLAATVRTSQGLFQAKRVLVTLPLGVLKAGSVQFAPALPRAKQQAIKALGMGRFAKLAMAFPSVSWPDQDFLGYTGDKGAPVFFNAHRVTGKPILVALAAGSQAASLQDSGNRVEDCLDALGKILGKKIGPPVRTSVTSWIHDPHARGAYCFAAVGSTGKDHEELARPVNDQIFFAGEATILRSRGTVHGALASGKREARKILALK